MSFPKVSLFSLTDFFPCMFLVSRCFRYSSISMASKRKVSEDTNGNGAGAIAKKKSMSGRQDWLLDLCNAQSRLAGYWLLGLHNEKF